MGCEQVVPLGLGLGCVGRPYPVRILSVSGQERVREGKG